MTSGFDPTPGGLIDRLVGVVMRPRATYADVAATPRLASVLLFLLAVNVVASLVFFSTAVGQQALADQLVRSMESFGRTVSDSQYARLQEMAHYSPGVAAAGQIVLFPVALLLASGVIFAVFSGLLRGPATFRQVAAVVAYSGVLVTAQQVLTLVAGYVRETLSSPTNLSALLPMLEEDSFPARLAGGVDLLRVWWILSVAVGIAVLYRRRLTPVASGLLAFYAIVALAFAAAQAVLSGA